MLKVVAELHAFVTQRVHRAQCAFLAEAEAAAFAADKPAIREIDARIGQAAGVKVTAAKARKIAVAV